MQISTIDMAAWDGQILSAEGFAAFELTVSEAARDPLPVVVAKNGDGPRVLVVGGTHGDEFEGQVAVASLVRRLPALDLAGTIVALPRHNVSACRAGTRVSPIDGADINRAYPGLGGEGPSAKIAAFVTKSLIPQVDWLIDLHSGGSGHEFVLSSNLQARAGSEDDRDLRPALAAFGAPYAILFDDLGTNVMPHRGTLEGAARACGVRCISSELGGGARLTKASMACAETGLSDLLAYIGVIAPHHRSGRAVSPAYFRLDRSEHYVESPDAGIFGPAVDLGESVSAGTVIGYLHRATHHAAQPVALCSRVDGVVVALTARALLRAGDVAVMVAEPA